MFMRVLFLQFFLFKQELQKHVKREKDYDFV